MMKVVLATAVGIVISLSAGAPSAQAENRAYQPDLTLDLHNLGYREPEMHRMTWGEQRILGAPLRAQNEVAFTSPQTLALSFIVPNPNPGLSVRGKVLGGHFIFETIFVNANNGAVLRTEPWSNGSGQCGFFPLADGRFVIWHDLDLDLHAADGSLLKTISLDANKYSSPFGIFQSASGETLFVSRPGRSGAHIVRLRAMDLTEISEVDLPGHYSSVSSDSYFAYVVARGLTARPPMALFVLPLAGLHSMNESPDPTFVTGSPGCDSPAFLDDETLAMSGDCPTLTLLNTSGRVLYQKSFGDVRVSRVIACRDCNLLVFGTYALTGGSSWSDTFPKSKFHSVVILDRGSKRSVEIPDKSAKYDSGMALSSGGCLLAIQRDSVLRVYRLCNSPIAEELQHRP